MTTDPFTDAARAEAERRIMGGSRFAHTTRDLLVGMAEWARTHLAAQEPTDAEVEAAARAIQTLSDDTPPWERTAAGVRDLYREDARAALSAARNAGRAEA